MSSLEKGIVILDALSGDWRWQTLSQLCERTGLARSTAHRLLRVLCDSGLVRRAGNAYVGAGPGLGPLEGRRRIVLPYLLSLYERTRLTVNVGVARGFEVAYVERVYGLERVPTPSDRADVAPLHCTATGKVLLAFDDRLRDGVRANGVFDRLTSRTVTRFGPLDAQLALVRAERVAYAQEEFAPGVSCVAAPVVDRGGRLLMVLSVAGPSTGLPLRRLSSAVGGTAEAVSRAVRSS